MYRRFWIVGLLLTLFAIPLTGALAQDGGSTIHKLDLARLRHEYQGWNNCGPTTLTMGLSYYGYSSDQNPAALFLKPHREDKNVSPAEMVDYVNEQVPNTQALYRPGGDIELIKSLLASDFPVIVEKGYEPEGYEWMGHYLLLVGYNEDEGYFYTYDSFSGHGNFQGLHESYDHLAEYWWHFSNTFIAIYTPDREAELMEVLGERADLTTAYQLTAQTAVERLQLDSNDTWAWFNVADALTELGQYEQATQYFRVAIDKGLPWRTMWYRHTPFEAFYQAGYFDKVLELVSINLANTPYVEEWYYYRGLVYASRGQTDQARAEFAAALQYNLNDDETSVALAELDNGTFQVVAEATQ